MEFVNPALLAGAAMAAVPLILHLVMRQKPRLLEFPALRFIRQRREVNQRRLRFQHWLLLALRVAAICLLALALARPSMQAASALGDQEAPVTAALVFDTAPRMAYRHENQSRIEVAKQIGTWLVGQLPVNSQVAVVDGRMNSAVYQVDLGAARQRVERLEILPGSRPVVEALDEALELLAKTTEVRKELYVFTDLAQSAWGSTSAEKLAARLALLRGVGVYVVDVGVDKPQNFSLGELHLSSQVLSAQSPLLLTGEVRRQGSASDRTVELYLADAKGEPQKRSEEESRLAGNESKRVDFTLGGLAIGTHQGMVRLVGEDALPADDVRYFTVDVQPAWRVLIAAGAPTQLNASYLTEALAPEKFRKQGIARFQCEVVGWKQLATVPLDKYSAVCLLDPPALERSTWDRLRDYAGAGGGVALFLGRAALPIDAFNTAAEELLPGPLTREIASETTLTTEQLSHPMLTKFQPLAGGVPWDDFPVYHYWLIDKPTAGTAIVASYRDRNPALLERAIGQGRVVTLTTSLSDGPDQLPEPWNRLLTGIRPWPCFMLVNELAQYLVGSAEGRLNYAVGQTAVVRLAPAERVANYVLQIPNGDQLRRAATSGQHALTITSTDWPGQYRLRAGGEAQSLDRGFSVNLSPEATELDRLPPDGLKKILGDEGFRMAKNQAEIDREINAGRVGRELYPLLIIFVVVVLGLEQTVANRFYRAR